MTRNRTRTNQGSHSLVLGVGTIANMPAIPDFFPDASGKKQVRPVTTADSGRVPAEAIRARIQAAGCRVLLSSQLVDQREQRQVHRNNHAADNPAEEDDHNRLESREQVLYR